MVKFDDKHNDQYQNLENNIVMMIKGNQSTDPTSFAARARNEAGSSLPYQDSSNPAHQRNTDNSDGYPGRHHQNITYINNFAPTSGYGHQPIHSTEGSSDRYHGVSSDNNHLGRERLPTSRTFPRSEEGPRRDIRPLRASESTGHIDLINQSLEQIQLNPQTPRHQTFGPDHTLQGDNDRVFNRLRMFDTVFLVDDTGSMKESISKKDLNGTTRWQAAKEAIEHVGNIALNKDPDGVDLKFLQSDESGDNITNIEDLVDMLDNTELDELGGGTFFQDKLEEIIRPRLEAYRKYKQQLASYDSEVQRLGSDRRARVAGLSRPQKPKKLNSIVVTDGSADDQQEVESYIMWVASKLDKLGAPASQIRIQFVQVGDDSQAATFLRHLDNGLKIFKTPPIRDVSIF